jgi:osmotically-inducible protein OsmY
MRAKSEQDTETSLRRALAASLDIDDLKVFIVRGVPHLEGAVGSLGDKRRAEAIAGSIFGKTRLVNHLRVAPRFARSDEAIAQAARKRLQALAPTISVRCQSGVAYLTGEVESWALRQAADRAVRPLPGVLNLINALLIKTDERSVEESEREIRRALRQILFLDNVSVKLEEGTLWLSGQVPSLYHRLAAEDLARWFSPVREVVNGLKAPGPLLSADNEGRIRKRRASTRSA